MTELKKWSETLLGLSADDEKLVPTINEIHGFYKGILNLSGFESDIKKMAAVPTAAGMALGLNHAAQCLLDYKRTLKFLKGIVAAIHQKKEKNNGQLVNIFYAGCGPYAPFVNLVAPLFSPEKIRFSILEINGDSLDFAKKLIDKIGHSEFIDNYYLADAVTFKVPHAEKYDIVFSETLDALLFREAYVPICWNLRSQFSNDIVFIPETVNISASFFKNIQEGEVVDEPELIEKVFDVREDISPFLNKIKLPDRFPSKNIEFKEKGKYGSMVLDTTVEIYNDIRLNRGESSLTLPTQFALEEDSYPHSLEFFYCLKPQVELKYTIH